MSIESITIDPKVVDPDDVEMLQDLVLADEEMGKLTGGLVLPGGGMPF